MHHDRFMGLLWGEILLFALFAASLALYLAYPDLQTPYNAPQLKLALQTVFMLTGGLVAVLSATRFTVGAAWARMRFPTAVEPVNDTMSTAGSVVSSSAASLPCSTTTLSTPAGSPTAS